MNPAGSNLRPVTLAELQALETRVSTLIQDLICWIEGSESRRPDRVSWAQTIRDRLDREIRAMTPEAEPEKPGTTSRMFPARY